METEKIEDNNQALSSIKIFRYEKPEKKEISIEEGVFFIEEEIIEETYDKNSKSTVKRTLYKAFKKKEQEAPKKKKSLKITISSIFILLVLAFIGYQFYFKTKITFMPEKIDFAKDKTSESIILESNKNKDIWKWQLKEELNWLELEKTEGEGNSNVKVSVDRSKLETGLHNGNILLLYENKEFSMPVSIEAQSILFIDIDKIEAGKATSQIINIENKGDGLLKWEASKNAEWISLNKISETQLEVKISDEGLEAGKQYEDIVNIKSNGGDKAILVYFKLDAKLFVDTDKIETDSSTNKTIKIVNKGAGKLEWDCEKNVDWISLNKVSLNKLTVKIDVKDFEPKTYEGQIIIKSNGGEHIIPVIAKLAANLFVDTKNIETADSITKRVKIVNKGSGKLEWEATKDADWITVNKIDENFLEVKIDASGLELKPHQGQIIIKSNGGDHNIPVSLKLVGKLIVDTEKIEVGGAETKIITVESQGSAIINWEANKEGDWIVLNKKSDKVLEVQILDSSLEANKLYEGKVIISSNAGNFNIPVSIKLAPIIDLDKASIGFGAISEIKEEKVQILNKGKGTLEWEAKTNDAWITVTKISPEELSIKVDPKDLKPNEKTEGKVSLTSNGGDKEIVVSFTKVKLLANRFFDNEDGTITDTKTKLMWKKCSEGLVGANCSDGKATQLNWDDAMKYAEDLTDCGFDDWRLPLVYEIKNIADPNSKPTINSDAFPNTQSDFYWSGSPYMGDEKGAWAQNFAAGGSYYSLKKEERFIRLVRKVNK